jgi:signal transduction histidine kinase
MWKRKRFILVFGLILGVLAANAFVSWRATQVLIENQRLVAETHDVIRALLLIQSSLSDAETGQRGFIITGAERYLEPYQTAVARLDNELNHFNALTANEAQHQQRLIQLRRHAAEKLAEMEETISLRRSGQWEAARAVVRSDRGRQAMNEIRRLISEAEAEVQEMRASRLAESRASGQRTIFTFALVNLLAISFVALAFYLNQRELETRAQAHAALEKANAELEHRVADRTAQLTTLNQELARSNRELQDFAYVASHDLPEPLRKIQAFGDLLKTEYAAALGAEGSDFIARMQNAALRMNRLISDLLEFSRVTTKAQPFTQVDLTEVAREVVTDLETRIRQSGGQVDIGALPVVEADATQMRQLLQNLIANALKFHRPDAPPLVSLKTAKPESLNQADQATANGFCQIAVSDNGIGFDEKYLDRIFTPFERLHARGGYEGTGMGLAVCRKIVERHGGAITARSTPGAGRVFLVSLPVRQADRPAQGRLQTCPAR